MLNNQQNGNRLVFPVCPLSAKQLSDMYGVNIKTFRKWLKPFQRAIGEKHGHYYNVAQVKTIIQSLGIPNSIIIE